MKKINWKLVGGIALVLAIIALIVYKPWMSEAEKKKAETEKKAKKEAEEKAKKDAEAAAGIGANATNGRTQLIRTPVGNAVYTAN